MQDILIVYDSKTGNTEKVAKALAEAAGERCVLAQVDAAPAAAAMTKKLTTAVLHTRRSWLSVPMPISTTLTCKNNRTLPTTLF